MHDKILSKIEELKRCELELYELDKKIIIQNLKNYEKEEIEFANKYNYALLRLKLIFCSITDFFKNFKYSIYNLYQHLLPEKYRTYERLINLKLFVYNNLKITINLKLYGSTHGMSGDIGIRKVFIKTYVTDIKLEYGYTTFDSEMYYFTLKYKDAKKKFDEYVELIGNQKNAIDVIDLFINDKKKRIEEKKL